MLMVVENGKRTYLWEDAGCGLVSLREILFYLYCICTGVLDKCATWEIEEIIIGR